MLKQYVSLNRSKYTLERITEPINIKNIHLPRIVWLILIFTCFAHVGDMRILGFRIAGWAWVIPMTLSVFIILRNPKHTVFPLPIWIPWILFLLVQLLTTEYAALQRTAQLISPVVVGMAVSTYRIQPVQIQKLIHVCKRFSLFLFLLALYTTGVLTTGSIPRTTGLAAPGMTCVLMCCLFAVTYSFGEKADLKYWLLMAGYTVFGIVRITIIGAFLTLPLALLTLGRISLVKRMLVMLLFLGLCMAVFFSDRFQSKMFRTGSGTVADISYSSESISDSGRRFMWDNFWPRITANPWLGYGSGSGEAFTRIITMGTLSYPHNDYLLTLHDYGILGLSIFILTIIASMFHAWKRSRQQHKYQRILFLSGILSFIAFLVMMITDNIMVYNNFYGNLQFTILGLAYAASAQFQTKDKSLPQK